MKKFLGISVLISISAVLWFTCTNCRAIRHNGNSSPISHEQWDALLKKHVCENGFVDYKGFQTDKTALDSYLKLLENNHPGEKWSRNEQMAYWINAYNAYTVQLVAEHFPVESIKDIKKGIPFVSSVWDIKFIKIQGQTYDLNNIEHNILRPIFKDARVHAAVNCASFSCPKLQRDAFEAANLDAQLDAAMRSFVNDPLRNRISANKAEVSEIFKWFKGDFKENNASVKDFINQYAVEKISEKTELDYIDYDWRVNSLGNAPN